jgi:hypothetical protein
MLTTALGLLAMPAMGQSYGGGGLVLQQSSLNWRVPDTTRTNAVGCIGGIGFGVRDGKRTGGEGHWCSGPYANLAMGGVHFGVQGKRAGSWLMAYNTVGAGWVGVTSPTAGRVDGVFAYTRPTVGGGLAVSTWAAVEAGLFVNVPVNLVRVQDPTMNSKVTFPHAGFQVSLLFGDFTRRNRGPTGTPKEAPPLAMPEDRRPPPPRDGPPSRPRPAPAPTGPLRPGDLPPADGNPPPPPSDEEGPLAIPG